MVETNTSFGGNPFTSRSRKKCVTFLKFSGLSKIFSSYFRPTGSSINANSLLFIIYKEKICYFLKV